MLQVKISKFNSNRAMQDLDFLYQSVCVWSLKDSFSVLKNLRNGALKSHPEFRQPVMLRWEEEGGSDESKLSLHLQPCFRFTSEGASCGIGSGS